MCARACVCVLHIEQTSLGSILKKKSYVVIFQHVRKSFRRLPFTLFFSSHVQNLRVAQLLPLTRHYSASHRNGRRDKDIQPSGKNDIYVELKIGHSGNGDRRHETYVSRATDTSSSTEYD